MAGLGGLLLEGRCKRLNRAEGTRASSLAVDSWAGGLVVVRSGGIEAWLNGKARDGSDGERGD